METKEMKRLAYEEEEEEGPGACRHTPSVDVSLKWLSQIG